MSDDRTRQKWARIMQKGVETVIREQPDAFLRRVRRGVPGDYRYVNRYPSFMQEIGGMFGRPACIVVHGKLKVFTPNFHRLRTPGLL